MGKVPHKWQKEMDAQAAGKVVQFRVSPKNDWRDPWGVDWNFDSTVGEYRIKPEQKVLYGYIGPASHAPFAVRFAETRPTAGAELKLTFEDDKLIAAEVLKYE